MDVNLSHLRNSDTEKSLVGITLTYLAVCQPPAHRYVTHTTATGIDQSYIWNITAFWLLSAPLISPHSPPSPEQPQQQVVQKRRVQPCPPQHWDQNQLFTLFTLKRHEAPQKGSYFVCYSFDCSHNSGIFFHLKRQPRELNFCLVSGCLQACYCSGVVASHRIPVTGTGSGQTRQRSAQILQEWRLDTTIQCILIHCCSQLHLSFSDSFFPRSLNKDKAT